MLDAATVEKFESMSDADYRKFIKEIFYLEWPPLTMLLAMRVATEPRLMWEHLSPEKIQEIFDRLHI